MLILRFTLTLRHLDMNSSSAATVASQPGRCHRALTTCLERSLSVIQALDAATLQAQLGAAWLLYTCDWRPHRVGPLANSMCHSHAQATTSASRDSHASRAVGHCLLVPDRARIWRHRQGGLAEARLPNACRVKSCEMLLQHVLAIAKKCLFRFSGKPTWATCRCQRSSGRNRW
jgi:hypothetical protein